MPRRPTPNSPKKLTVTCFVDFLRNKIPSREDCLMFLTIATLPVIFNDMHREGRVNDFEKNMHTQVVLWSSHACPNLPTIYVI